MSLSQQLTRWSKDNQTLLSNAGSLVSSNALTMGLGFVYWWVAARLFPSSAVGIASAAISAMMLLSNVAALGLGTFLIGELPRQRDQAAALIVTALFTASAAGVTLGLLFALLSPYISHELGILAASSLNILLFSLGVALSTAMIVLDQAMIGLLQSNYQLQRNGLFAIAKIILLPIATFTLLEQQSLAIYTTWSIGILCSLAVFRRFSPSIHGRLTECLPRWRLLRRIGPAALMHHFFNLSMQAPGLVLPLIVTSLLSASQNASFYIAWTFTIFLSTVTISLATVLYAIGASEPELLAQKMRHTLKLSFGAVLIGSSLLFVGADIILGLFGPTYVEQASWCLRILALGAFPQIIRQHYIAVQRINGRLGSAMPSMLFVTVFRVLSALVGTYFAGLTGLAIGWLVAGCLEALISMPTVLRALHLHNAPRTRYSGLVPGTLPSELSGQQSAVPISPAMIRSLRLEANLGYIDLAVRTGIPARCLAELEYGLRTASPEQLQQLARALGIPDQER